MENVHTDVRVYGVNKTNATRFTVAVLLVERLSVNFCDRAMRIA